MNQWQNFLWLLSMSAIGIGVWWIYPPASLIVIGSLLLVQVLYAYSIPVAQPKPKPEKPE